MLTKVEIQVDDNHTNNVVLDEKRNLGLVLNYPSMNTIPMGVSAKHNAEQIFKTIVSCQEKFSSFFFEQNPQKLFLRFFFEKC